MPKFDGTGPMDLGPRTGRGFGPCGYGGRRYFSPKNELAFLEREIEALKEELTILKEEKEVLEKAQKE